MKISVTYQKDEKIVDIEEPTVENALRAANIGVESVITKHNGKIVPDTTTLNDGDKIEAIRIVSGG